MTESGKMGGKLLGIVTTRDHDFVEQIEQRVALRLRHCRKPRLRWKWEQG